VSLIASEPLFSSRRDNLVVPGSEQSTALRKQPRQRVCAGVAFFCSAILAQQIHQRLIRLAVFWSEARDDVRNRCYRTWYLRYFASEEAPAERAEWNEPDS